MKGARGVVLFECMILLELPIVLLLVVIGVGMNLELVRRCRVEIFAHHLAFAFARGRALGLGRRPLEKEMEGFRLSRARLEESLTGEGLRIWVYHKYDTLFRFPYFHQGKAFTKRHFEVTRTCLFPF